MGSAPGIYFVSVQGSDAWSGTRPEPDAAGTDGPFRTLARARDTLRAAPKDRDRRIVLRAGTHHLEEPLLLDVRDSGTPDHPLIIQAYPGEEAVLSGGRVISGWTHRTDGVWAAPVPQARTGEWTFRQLRVGDRIQTLARHPNRDPDNPTTGGWLFARQSKGASGDWTTTMANIHTPGDWMEWDLDLPADGEYALWLYYGQLMKNHGRDNMDGQTAFQVDGGDDVPLVNLPDTGGWRTHKWSRCATLPLTRGKHTLRWTNRKGGGIDFNAFALCTAAGWQPETTDLPPVPAGHHLLVVQAETHDRGEGREMSVSRMSPTGKRDELPFAEGDIPRDWDLSTAQVSVFPAWGWVGGPVQVGGVDHEKGILRLTGQNAQQEIRLGNRYCIENVREALDEPGEFFLDRQAGELLLRPDCDDIRGERVVAPVHDRLIHIQGDPETDTWPEHIHIRGLHLRDSTYSIAVRTLYEPDDAAVWLDHARDCVVEDCTFSHLGGYAVKLLNNTTRCRILACPMFDLGQGGVITTGPTATQATDCVVAGCHMHHLGRVYKHVAGVYITTGSRHRVAHCTIADVPRYAISFKSYNGDAYSHDNVAEFNEMLRTNLETNDTGAIETLGRDRKPSGNIIRHNIILDVVGMKHKPEGGLITPFYTWGVYLDDYSSGTHVYGNIVARTYRGGYHNHLGFDNIVENNVFVDGKLYQAEWNGKADMRRNVFRRNIVVFSDPDAVYIKSGGWSPEVLDECDANVVWCSGEDLTHTKRGITPAGNWAKWQELGFDRTSVVAPPLFIDAENDDYRLQSSSPALALGFKPIPVDRIGVKGYRKEP